MPKSVDKALNRMSRHFANLAKTGKTLEPHIDEFNDLREILNIMEIEYDIVETEHEVHDITLLEIRLR